MPRPRRSRRPNEPDTLTFLGAAGTVTGSQHFLEDQGRRLLMDCGLFRGSMAIQATAI